MLFIKIADLNLRQRRQHRKVCVFVCVSVVWQVAVCAGAEGIDCWMQVSQQKQHSVHNLSLFKKKKIKLSIENVYNYYILFSISNTEKKASYYLYDCCVQTNNKPQMRRILNKRYNTHLHADTERKLLSILQLLIIWCVVKLGRWLFFTWNDLHNHVMMGTFCNNYYESAAVFPLLVWV